MSEELKQKILEYIQEYQAIRIDLAPRVSFLRFKVDLSEYIVEEFKKENKLLGGKTNESLNASFMVFEKDFDNYANAQLIVARIKNRRLGDGFIALQENTARVERLQDPESYSPKKYIRQIKESVVEDFLYATNEAGVSENDKELIASQLLQEQQDKMIKFRDKNRERALDMAREKGSDQQIATKNKEFISYREDEYVDFNRAWMIKGEIDNDRSYYFKLNNIYLEAVSDREKSFALFDINKYVQKAEKVVKDYTEKEYGSRSYLDSNDSDLVAMELLYEMEKERNM